MKPGTDSSAGIQVIFWDFDGVLLNSNAVRDRGFIEVLREFPEEQVQALLEFHHHNGGLSRYVKFRYFFEQIRQEPVSAEAIAEWSARFSAIMRQLLTDKSLLIAETTRFVAANHDRYRMHIVSGSDQAELRYLCGELGIAQYFLSIHGSPTPKTELVRQILSEQAYDPLHGVLIGDSRNDYDAALDNGLHFMAYNNPGLEDLTTVVIGF